MHLIAQCSLNFAFQSVAQVGAPATKSDPLAQLKYSTVPYRQVWVGGTEGGRRLITVLYDCTYRHAQGDLSAPSHVDRPHSTYQAAENAGATVGASL